jgi:hypothetical protein
MAESADATDFNNLSARVGNSLVNSVKLGETFEKRW